MKGYNKIIGNFGEDEAVKFLKKKGYIIEERNFMCKCGEIDIIAIDKDCLVFVEVKTRTNNKYGKPSDAVDYFKRKHIVRTAICYINFKNKTNCFSRFDIVEVFIKNVDNKYEIDKINLIKNAFTRVRI